MYEAAGRGSVGSGRTRGRRIVPIAMLLIIAALWLAGCAGGGDTRRNENGASAPEAAGGEDGPTAAGTGTGAGTKQMSATAEDLRALLVDVATARICQFLEGRLIPLSGSTGSEDSSSGGSSPAAGGLLIRSCSATEIDPQHLRVEVSGTGWQWIASEKQQVGATFELDETVSFDVDITFTGTLDIAYDRQDSILTLWLVPTEPVAAEFDVTEKVQVATEGLWSSIVGTAATIIGGSPEQRAESTIQERGSRKIESRLDRGLTVVLDLCTGRQFVTFGSLPEGRFPASAHPDDPAPPLSRGRARLYPDGMLMFGPFTTSGAVIARIDELSGGGVHASPGLRGGCPRDRRCIRRGRRNSPMYRVSESRPSASRARDGGSEWRRKRTAGSSW